MKSTFFPATFSLALLVLGITGLGAAEPTPAGRWPIEVRDRPVLGRDTAPVVVVEVTNFKCAHCRAFHENVFPALRSEYVDPGKVQWVVLNASSDPADEAEPIFAIARCALGQGQYWALLGRFFAVARRPASALAELVANSPLLDKGALEICRRDPATAKALSADFSEYARLGLRRTPSFLVSKLASDGRRTDATVAGLPTLDYFRQVLDKMLKAP